MPRLEKVAKSSSSNDCQRKYNFIINGMNHSILAPTKYLLNIIVKSEHIFCYEFWHFSLFGGFRLCTVVRCISNLTVIILLIEKILIILMILIILIITSILTILLILIILTIHGSTCSTYFWCPEHLCTASSKLRSLHPPWKEKDENLISFFYFTKLTLDSGRGSSPQFHLEQKSGV